MSVRRLLVVASVAAGLALPATASYADHLCVPKTVICADFCIHTGGDPWHPPTYCTR